MPEFFHDLEQGSAEWFEARMGIPTASEFSTVLAEGREGLLPASIMDAMVKNGCTAAQLAAASKAARAKGASPSTARLKYLRELAGEVITGEPSPAGFSNDHTERGKDQENDARRMFSLITDLEPIRVGFVREGRAGCSPDSLIGEDSGLEIKCAIPSVQIERLMRGTMPTEHVAQVQGSMWVTGRATWHFVSYCPRLPPLILTVHRDETYIARLSAAVTAFNEELDSIVDAIRTYQDFRGQAAA